MSYYYRVHISLILRKDTPQCITDFLVRAIESNLFVIPDNEPIFNHKFFTLDRWASIFHHHIDLDPPRFIKHTGGYYDLQLDANINYGSEEIHEFTKWITPYVAGRKKKQYIGWYKGESHEIQSTNLYAEREAIQ